MSFEPYASYPPTTLLAPSSPLPETMASYGYGPLRDNSSLSCTATRTSFTPLLSCPVGSLSALQRTGR